MTSARSKKADFQNNSLSCHLTLAPLWSAKEGQVPEMQFLFLHHLSASQHQIFLNCSTWFHEKSLLTQTIQWLYRSHGCLGLMQLLEENGLIWFPYSTGRGIWLFSEGIKRPSNSLLEDWERMWFQHFAFHPHASYFGPRCNLRWHYHDCVGVNPQCTWKGDNFPPPK